MSPSVRGRNIRGRTLAVLAGTVVAIGGATVGWRQIPGADDPPPAAGTANLWVDGVSATCTRSATPVTYEEAASPDARCGSLDQAYDAANLSALASSVIVRGGTYFSQTITGNRSSTNRITFTEAEGESWVNTGNYLVFGVGGNNEEPTQGPDYITMNGFEMGTFAQDGQNNRYGIAILHGSSNITIENFTNGGWYMNSVFNIIMQNGISGPCRAAPMAAFGGVPNRCELNKVDGAACQPDALQPLNEHPDCHNNENITYDGIEFFGYDIGPGCIEQAISGPDGCHHRAMFVTLVDGFTLRNSTFHDNVFSPWTSRSGAPVGTDPHNDFLIENNQFGTGAPGCPGASCSGGLEIGWCTLGTPQPTYTNITIRFNSFAGDASLNLPGWYSGEASCTVSNFKVYGNILGSRPNCTTSGVDWAYNVYAEGTITCDATDVAMNGSGMPFYTNDTNLPHFGDFELTGAAFAADDLVPSDDPTYPCPTFDIQGNLRPSGIGLECDAGAYER